MAGYASRKVGFFLITFVCGITSAATPAVANVVDHCNRNDAKNATNAVSLYEGFYSREKIDPVRTKICVTEGSSQALLDIWDAAGAYIGVVRLHGPKSLALDAKTCWRGEITKVNLLPPVEDNGSAKGICIRGVFEKLSNPASALDFDPQQVIER